jgi:hypothetical protein
VAFDSGKLMLSILMSGYMCVLYIYIMYDIYDRTWRYMLPIQLLIAFQCMAEGVVTLRIITSKIAYKHAINRNTILIACIELTQSLC